MKSYQFEKVTAVASILWCSACAPRFNPPAHTLDTQRDDTRILVLGDVQMATQEMELWQRGATAAELASAGVNSASFADMKLTELLGKI